MVGLAGEIRFTVRMHRREFLQATRFALRTLPACRRARRSSIGIAVVLLVVAAAIAANVRADGQDLGEAVGFAAPLLAIVTLQLLLTSSRYRAWAIVRLMLRDLPDEYDGSYRFDAAGYEGSGAGRSVTYAWSTLSTVVEGDRFLAIGIGRTQFISALIEKLTEAERAAIRRWAESAPGGPRWIVRRSTRANPRLRVSPSPHRPLSSPAPSPPTAAHPAPPPQAPPTSSPLAPSSTSRPRSTLPPPPLPSPPPPPGRGDVATPTVPG